jgi:hypothetical protein
MTAYVDDVRHPFRSISVEHGVTRFLWLREAPGSIEATTIMMTAQGLATVPTPLPRVVKMGRG